MRARWVPRSSGLPEATAATPATPCDVTRHARWQAGMLDVAVDRQFLDRVPLPATTTASAGRCVAR